MLNKKVCKQCKQYKKCRCRDAIKLAEEARRLQPSGPGTWFVARTESISGWFYPRLEYVTFAYYNKKENKRRLTNGNYKINLYAFRFHWESGVAKQDLAGKKHWEDVGIEAEDLLSNGKINEPPDDCSYKLEHEVLNQPKEKIK